jgi:ribonuclease HI
VTTSSYDFFIFTDASFDADSGQGIGACITLNQSDWQKTADAANLPIHTKVFRQKTIARLELITALWALEQFESEHKTVVSGSVLLITDCKSIADLPQRRKKLEAGGFQSRRTSLPLTNADLYRKFFDAYDKLHPTILWIEGHSPSGKRGDLQRIFSRVDRAARQALRKHRKKNLQGGDVGTDTFQ